MRLHFVLLLVASVASCDGGLTAPQRGGEPAQTDQVTYLAVYVSGEGTYRQYGVTLISTLKNATGRTLYLGRCFPDSPHPMYDVELVDGHDDWGAAYSGAWACVGHDKQFVLAPGEVRPDTFRIAGPNAWDGHTGQPFGALEGTFRLRYYVSTCPGDYWCPAPDSAAVSNRFTVRVKR